VELDGYFHSGSKFCEGEAFRDGPYVTRFEANIWSRSRDSLELFLRYLVCELHYREYGTLDDCPGSFQGHIVVQDPFCNGEFPTGWYRIQIWVKDNLLFHGHEVAEPLERASDTVGYHLGEAIWAYHLPEGDIRMGHYEAFEAPETWVSYRTGLAVTGGTPIGMHACFVGPELYQVG